MALDQPNRGPLRLIAAIATPLGSPKRLQPFSVTQIGSREDRETSVLLTRSE